MNTLKSTKLYTILFLKKQDLVTELLCIEGSSGLMTGLRETGGIWQEMVVGFRISMGCLVVILESTGSRSQACTC